MSITTSRSLRNTHILVSGSSSSVVGPGSYDPLIQHDVGSYKSDLHAPFLSFADKPNLIPPKGPTKDFPGPGTYSHESTQIVTHNFGDVSSLKNAGSRLCPQTTGSTIFCQSSLVDNPGPGSYSPSDFYRVNENLGGQIHHAEPVIPSPRAAPSIPRDVIKKQNFPLPEPEDPNDPMMNPHLKFTGTRSDRVGPGQYNPEPEITCHSPRKVDFHASHSPRTKMWIEHETKAQIKRNEAGASKAFAIDSSILIMRNSPNVSAAITAKNRVYTTGILGTAYLPAPPAHLPIHSTKDENEDLQHHIILESARFPIDSIERTKGTLLKSSVASSSFKSHTPRNASEPLPLTLTKAMNEGRNPSSVTSGVAVSESIIPADRREKRRIPKGNEATTPGPGSYDVDVITGMCTQVKTVVNERVRGKMDFGSTSDRQAVMLHKYPGCGLKFTSEVTPAPGDYDVDKWANGFSNAGSAVVEQRRPEPVARVDAKLYRYGVHNPATVQLIREANGKPLHAFKTTDERTCCSSMLKVPTGRSAPPPPVGTYDPSNNQTIIGKVTTKINSSSLKGAFGSATPRFMESSMIENRASEVPPPTIYNVEKPKSILIRDLGAVFKSLSKRPEPHSRKLTGANPSDLNATLVSISAHAGMNSTFADGSSHEDGGNGMMQSGANPKARMKAEKQETDTFKTKNGVGVPGPAEYSPILHADYKNPFRKAFNSHIAFSNTSDRFRASLSLDEKRRATEPGPASYAPVDGRQVLDHAPVVGSSKRFGGDARDYVGDRAGERPRIRNHATAAVGSYNLGGSFDKKSFNVTLNRKISGNGSYSARGEKQDNLNIVTTPLSAR